MTLVSTDNFCVGALALFYSLRETGSKYPLYILLTSAVSNEFEQKLAKIDGINIIRVAEEMPVDLHNLNYEENKRLNNTFDKLRIFGLVQFDKLVFIDSDTFVLKNIDHLFDYPNLSAVLVHNTYMNPNPGSQFSSGLMVIEPNEMIFKDLIRQLSITAASQRSKGRNAFGDQNVLNEYFNKWLEWESVHLKDEYCALWGSIEKMLKSNWTLSGEAGKTEIAILHFAGPHKPWERKLSFLLKTVIRPIRYFHKLPNWNTIRIITKYFNIVRRFEKELSNVYIS